MSERKDIKPPKKLFGFKKRPAVIPGSGESTPPPADVFSEELNRVVSNGPASQPIDWSVNKGRLAQAEEIIRANTDKFEEFTQKVQQAAKDEHKHTS